MACPNISSDAWKNLVAKIGVFEAFREFIKHGETIPDASNYPESFKGVNATLKIVDALIKMPRNSYPSNQVAGFYNDLIKYGAPKNQIELLKQHIASQGIKEIDKTALIASLLSEMSYAVEIETATDQEFEFYDNERDWQLGDPKPYGEFPYIVMSRYDGKTIKGYNTPEEAKAEAARLNAETTIPSQHYVKLTVPGGVNYTENEIRTPDITPSIKGHAQFSTDKGIGWFRSDDRFLSNDKIKLSDLDNNFVNLEIEEFVRNAEPRKGELAWKISYMSPSKGMQIEIFDNKSDAEDLYNNMMNIIKTNTSKTRRILEVQSDLFQKGRNNELLKALDSDRNEVFDVKKAKEAISSSENQFLQLLNKDNNWVGFFVKSIIQDTARKGYEKVLFPSGDTAAKVEGHETIENFIKRKQERLDELLTLKKELRIVKVGSNFQVEEFYNGQWMTMLGSSTHSTIESAEKQIDAYASSKEIDQIKKEINDAKEGRSKFSAINKFYEDTIKNILDKRGYKPIRIKDEYGNQWFEVGISKQRDRDTIYFQAESSTTPSKASDSTLKKVREWMKRAGIEERAFTTEEVLASAGSIRGFADTLQGIVKILKLDPINVASPTGERLNVEGMDVEATVLPEEAMHFATEIVKQTNPELFKQMLSEIGNYNIYRDVFDIYKGIYKNKDGTANIRKIKEEAIARLLVEQIIKQNEGLTEKPELLKKSRTWWENILEWFRSLFIKAGFNPFAQVAKDVLAGNNIGSVADINNKSKPLVDEVMSILPQIHKNAAQQYYDKGQYNLILVNIAEQLEDDKTFAATVEQLLNDDYELADRILKYMENAEFFQVSPEQKTIIQNIDDKLKTYGITKVEKQDPEDEEESVSYYQKMVDGKPDKVKKRVTDFVKDRRPKEIIARFENAPADQKARRKKQALVGVTGHSDMENIIKAATDENGALIPMTEVKYPSGLMLKPEAAKALFNYLVGTPDNPGILYQNAIFPAGTIFRTEQIIYDEKRDIAGTIDLLAIQPDGKVSILDWKFIFQNIEKYPDVSFFKQKDIRIQLGQYRQILGTYGVDYNNFHKLEAIPIHLKVSFDQQQNPILTQLSIANPDVRQETRRYLLPVASTDQSTGNETLDKYVKSLYELYNAIYEKKAAPEHKELKIEQLNSISGAIRELQIKQEFLPFYQQANVFLKSTESLVEEYYEKFAGVDPKSDKLSDDQINDFLSRLNTTRENLPKYADLYAVFNSIYGDENLSPDQKDLSDRLAKLSGKASKLIKDIDIVYIGNQQFPGFVPRFIAQREGSIKGLEAPEKTVNLISRDFSIQSLVQTAAMQAGGNIYSKAVNKAGIDKQETLAEFKTLSDNFEKSGGKWSSLIDEKKNTLIADVKKEAYDKFNEATNPLKPDIKWLKENIDIERYKKETAEYLRKMEDEIQKQTFPHESDEQLNEERKKRIQTLRDNNSIDTDTSLGWFSKRLRRYLKRENFYTAEYEAIMDKPEALALYNFMRDFNYYARKTHYHDSTRQTIGKFLPWVKASTYERLKQGDGIKAVYEGFQAIAKIADDEEVYYGRQNPNTGEVLKSVPVFFTRKKDDVSYSQDVQRNFALYINSVIDHAYAVEVEDKMQAILEVEKTKSRLEVDENNNIKILENGKLAEVPNNSRNAELYESFVDSTIYGERFSKNQFLSPTQLKTVDNFNKYFRLKVFALNLITPFVNTFGGNLQAIINAGKYWKARDFLKNELKIVQNHFRGLEGNIEKGVLDYFIPLNTDKNQLTARRMTKDQLNKWSISEVLMSPMRYTDSVIEKATALTMIENAMIDENNQIVSIRDYVRKEFAGRYDNAQEQQEFKSKFKKRMDELKATKSLTKVAKFDSEGLLELPNIDRKSDTFISFRRKIQNEIKRINGSLSEDDRRNADRNIVQRSMMMFKNWIPLTVESRYGALKKNAATDEYQIGRARVFWQVLINGAKGNKFKGLVQGLKDLKDMSSANTKGLQLLADYYKRTADDYYKKTGKKLEMSKEEFFDMVRQAIASQIRDNIMLLSLFSLFAFVKYHAPDDDDAEENKNLYRTTLRVLDKSLDEISFYYNPVSFKQIMGGTLIPSIGILTDVISITSNTSREALGIVTDDEDLQKKAHPIKASLKAIPIANWFTSVVLPLIEPETAKELGIRVPAQNRF